MFPQKIIMQKKKKCKTCFYRHLETKQIKLKKMFFTLYFQFKRFRGIINNKKDNKYTNTTRDKTANATQNQIEFER